MQEVRANRCELVWVADGYKFDDSLAADAMIFALSLGAKLERAAIADRSGARARSSAGRTTGAAGRDSPTASGQGDRTVQGRQEPVANRDGDGHAALDGGTARRPPRGPKAPSVR